MRVDRRTIAEHHDAILAAAGRLFRRHGIESVPVAEVTRAAGLTHGAFYGHFPSKQALVADACRASMAEGAKLWTRRAERARAQGREPLIAIVEAYLSERHRDAPEEGCVLAALGPEIARAAPPLADALAAGVAALGAVLERELARRDPALPPDERSRIALAMLAAMTGGIILARACRADAARSRAALAAAARAARAAAGLGDAA